MTICMGIALFDLQESWVKNFRCVVVREGAVLGVVAGGLGMGPD
jgi:hypothetical protein